MWVPPHATHWMLLPMGYRSGVQGGVLLAACGRESAQSMRLLMWGASVPTSHGWRPASAWVISRCLGGCKGAGQGLHAFIVQHVHQTQGHCLHSCPPSAPPPCVQPCLPIRSRSAPPCAASPCALSPSQPPHHTCTHAHTHAHAHTRAHAHARTRMRTCAHAHAHARARSCSTGPKGAAYPDCLPIASASCPAMPPYLLRRLTRALMCAGLKLLGQPMLHEMVGRACELLPGMQPEDDSEDEEVRRSRAGRAPPPVALDALCHGALASPTTSSVLGASHALPHAVHAFGPTAPHAPAAARQLPGGAGAHPAAPPCSQQVPISLCLLTMAPHCPLPLPASPSCSCASPPCHSQRCPPTVRCPCLHAHTAVAHPLPVTQKQCSPTVRCPCLHRRPAVAHQPPGGGGAAPVGGGRGAAGPRRDRPPQCQCSAAAGRAGVPGRTDPFEHWRTEPLEHPPALLLSSTPVHACTLVCMLACVQSRT